MNFKDKVSFQKLDTKASPQDKSIISRFPFVTKHMDAVSYVTVGDRLTKSGTTRRQLFTQEHPEARGAMEFFPAGMQDLGLEDFATRSIDASALNTYMFSGLNVNRKIRYFAYEMIEDWHTEVGVALDTIADETCIRGLNGEIFDIIVSKADGSDPDEEEKTDIASIQTLSEALLFNELNISKHCWSIARNLAKYGDWFVEPVLGEKGIQDLKAFYDLDNVTVVELPDGLSYYVYTPQRSSIDTVGSDNVASDTMTAMIWQPAFKGTAASATPDQHVVYFDGELIHIKLENKPQYRPYGTSHLDPVRQTWEILKKMEDAMFTYRIIRAPERKVFKIATGKLTGNKAIEHVRRVQSWLKRSASPGPFEMLSGGAPYTSIADMDKRFRVVGMDEDFWIPDPEGGGSSSIEVLPGASNLSEIEDISYMSRKFQAGLRIPRAYLAYEDEVNRATLVQQDVRFARVVTRIQEAIGEGLEKMCITHLFAWYTGMSNNVRDLEKVQTLLNKYKITFRWTSASYIEENARYEGMRLRGEAAETFMNLFGENARPYITKAVFQLTPEEEELLLNGDIEEVEGDGLSGPDIDFGATEFGSFPGSDTETFGETPEIRGGEPPELEGAPEEEIVVEEAPEAEELPKEQAKKDERALLKEKTLAIIKKKKIKLLQESIARKLVGPGTIRVHPVGKSHLSGRELRRFMEVIKIKFGKNIDINEDNETKVQYYQQGASILNERVRAYEGWGNKNKSEPKEYNRDDKTVDSHLLKENEVPKPPKKLD